jgi:hypothetical protein
MAPAGGLRMRSRDSPRVGHSKAHRFFSRIHLGDIGAGRIERHRPDFVIRSRTRSVDFSYFF